MVNEKSKPRDHGRGLLYVRGKAGKTRQQQLQDSYTADTIKPFLKARTAKHKKSKIQGSSCHYACEGGSMRGTQ